MFGRCTSCTAVQLTVRHTNIHLTCLCAVQPLSNWCTIRISSLSMQRVIMLHKWSSNVQLSILRTQRCTNRDLMYSCPSWELNAVQMEIWCTAVHPENSTLYKWRSDVQLSILRTQRCTNGVLMYSCPSWERNAVQMEIWCTENVMLCKLRSDVQLSIERTWWCKYGDLMNV